MTAPTRKNRLNIKVENLPFGMTLGEFFAGIQEQQTKQGQNYSYAPVDPTIYPVEYKKPTFDLEDIKNLGIFCFPAGKVDIQRCDKEQKLLRIQMRRRQAFLELLNQAIWRYESGKNQIFLQSKDVLKKIKSIKSSIKRTQKLLCPTQDEAGIYIRSVMNKMGAPLMQAQLELANVLLYYEYFEKRTRDNIQNGKTIRAQSSKKSPYTGDGWYRNLIDDLCKIWVVIFRQDVGASLNSPVVNFIYVILQKAHISKYSKKAVKRGNKKDFSKESIRAMVKLWDKKHKVIL